jgi:large subunit ribosomal protein L4
VNRKARRAALRSALSVHAARGSIGLLDSGAFDEPSTKSAAEALAKWDQPRPTLVVLAEDEAAAAKSFRNLRRVAVLPAEATGVADLIGAASVVVSEAALAELTARAKGEKKAAQEAA